MAGKPFARSDYPDSGHNGTSFSFPMDRKGRLVNDDRLAVPGWCFIPIGLSCPWSYLKISQADTKYTLLYGYFAVVIFSAMLMEYEVHFHSSGAIEEEWTLYIIGPHGMVYR